MWWWAGGGVVIGWVAGDRGVVVVCGPYVGHSTDTHINDTVDRGSLSIQQPDGRKGGGAGHIWPFN